MKKIPYKKPFNLLSFFLHWEWILVLMIVFISIINSNLSPYFLNTSNLFDMTLNFLEKGLITLPMTYVIISGNLDFSVADILALSSCVMGLAFESGISIWLSAGLALGLGAIAGLINGSLITRLKIPSFAATLGTAALFRGLTWLLLENRSITGFPEEFTMIGRGDISGTEIPIQLILFFLLFIPAAIFLHRSTFGRHVFAIGGNKEVSRFSGVKNNKIIRTIFIFSGIVSAFSGILISARFGSVRADVLPNATLDVVTIVVLGGVSIAGGSGTLIGVALSMFLLGTTMWMGS